MNGLNDNEDFLSVPLGSKSWRDSTANDFINKRKDSFKVFTKSEPSVLLHIFMAGIYNGTEYFHTLFENFEENYQSDDAKPIAKYKLLTKDKIKTVYGLEF